MTHLIVTHSHLLIYYIAVNSLVSLSHMLTLFPRKHQGYKTVFMLNSTEHKIYPTHKC